MDYIELHCHSAFHFLAAASLPEDLVARAASLGYSTLALGDADGVYGAPRFYRAAREAGIRPLVGCTLTLQPWSNSNEPPRKGTTSLYVLVATRAGYRNVCRLLTRNKLAFAKGEAVLTWKELEGFTDGLVCLAREAVFSAPGHLATGALETLRRLFPGRLYLELHRHDDPVEELENRILCEAAVHFQLPVVATNDVRYTTPEGQSLLDVLTCIRHRTTIDAAGWLLERNAARHLLTREEIVQRFRDLPRAIANTRAIAEQCEFTLANLGYRFPDYPLPPGQTAQEHLRTLVYQGARERYRIITPAVQRQLEHELSIIGKLQLAGYFLIVWDIVRFCRENGILAQGRGSAANSAVCYALGITAVDPVGMDLLFERFLSEERGEWPDIDIDLPSGDQRERVLQYVYRRYGPHGAAMTANVITYRVRSAVREVGKALGFPAEQVDRLAKLLHRFEFRDPKDDLALQLRAAGLDPTALRTRLLVQLVEQIQHLPRHLGQHSGGMIIAAGRLDDIVPLEPARMPGRVVVQWDKDDCADLGIIKVDLLGLGMMAVLEEALPLVRQHEGIELDLAHLPPDDPATYTQLQRADTIGVFQVESRAQMATLPRLQPRCFYDLVVEVALIRPGPIVGQMVHPYLRRRAGREPITYPHPSLEPILKRTLGVPLFQEQLLRIAMTVAGFSGGEAEELRRAMGFKRSIERMRAIEAKLRSGMAARGITGKTADDIVRSITSFALYGFPESHAASFALLAYASAYLKAHHPAAFACALLNNWPMGFYHPATIVKDAQRHGVRVLPIDVTRSAWRCTLERMPDTSSRVLCLRLGLRYVRGLRAEAGEAIVAERTKKPFHSLEDFVHRTALRENELATLAEIGALAAFGHSRRSALWQIAAVPRGPLFARAATSAQAASEPKPSPLANMEPVERTLADYRGSGVTVGPHLLAHWRPHLNTRGALPARSLAHCAHEQWVRVAGHVIVRQRPGTAKGFCFLTLEDETGLANVVLTPALFERYRTLIHTAALLEAEGPLQKVDGVIHVRARYLRPLDLRPPRNTLSPCDPPRTKPL